MGVAMYMTCMLCVAIAVCRDLYIYLQGGYRKLNIISFAINLSVCISMYVCMYVCMSVCMSVCLHVCVYVCIRMDVCITCM